jgi:hypothetical protein
MATLLPALRRTWQIVGNVAVAGGAVPALHYGFLFAAKEALKGFPLSPWIVVGSSNGTVFGLDGADRWASPGSMAAGAWIVLKQPGLLSNFQLCWHSTLATSTDGRNEMFVSPAAGFTGGGATTRPTAADEIIITVNTSELDNNNTSTLYVNVALSDDGRATRLWAFQNRTVISWAEIELIDNSIAELTTPWLAYANNRLSWSASTGAASYNDVDGSGPIRGRQGATPLVYTLASAGAAGQTSRVGQLLDINYGVNQLSGDFPLVPVAVKSVTTAHKGLHGEIADFWFGSETAANGDTYPEAAFTGAGGLDQFVQVGDVILPWNGTVPLTGGAASTRRPGRVLYLWQSFDDTPPEVEEPAPPVIPATFVSQQPVDSGSALGVDFDVLSNFPKSMVLVSGRRNLANALARRLQTPAGFLAAAFDGDPDYGFDVRSRLNQSDSPAELGALEADIKAEVEKDERVLSAEVAVAFTFATGTLEVEIEVEDGEGPFELVLTVSALSTELVLG